MSSFQKRTWIFSVLMLVFLASPASAQGDLRYSWMDMSYMVQDIDRMGTKVPLPGQTVDVAASDGNGIRFRGSVGTWHNMYLFADYVSVDIDVAAVVTNEFGVFPAEDEFDYVTVRGGFGAKWSIRDGTDLFAEVTYDSVNFDLGSFAGEDFDTDTSDVGGAIGIRTMFGDNFEMNVHGRYSNLGDVDLTLGEFDSDVLYGVGFAWKLMRGLSIVGDFESGEFSNYALGFRLDLDED